MLASVFFASAAAALLAVVTLSTQGSTSVSLMEEFPVGETGLVQEAPMQSQYWTPDAYSQIQHYEAELQHAKEANAEMRKVIDHYRSAYNRDGYGRTMGYSPYTYDDLMDGHRTLGIAADTWASRERLLQRLQYEIVKEQGKLHKLHTEDAPLLKKHKGMQNQLKEMLQSSSQTARELKSLRDRYSSQIDKMQDEYHEARVARMSDDGQYYQRLKRGHERSAHLNADVAKAIATAKYYEGQVRRAKEDVSAFEERMERAAGDASYAKADLNEATQVALEQHEKEMEAVAARKVAQMKAHAVRAIMAGKEASAEEVARAKAKYMQEAMEAKVAVGIADAAKGSAKRAEATRSRLRNKLEGLRDDYDDEYKKIIRNKERADAAQSKAKIYAEKTDEAKATLDDALAAKEDATAQAKDAVKMVEEAEAKTALAKTQEKITQMQSEHIKSMSRLQIERMRRKVANAEEKLEKSKDEVEAMIRKNRAMQEEYVRSFSNAKDSRRDLWLAHQRAELAITKAARATEQAQEKKEKAEELLESVDSLAGMARQSSQIAAAEKAAKAAAANGGYAYVPGYGFVKSGEPAAAAPAAASSTQNIDIHVIPHSPVMGPAGDEGFAYTDNQDKGAKKLSESGINV